MITDLTQHFYRSEIHEELMGAHYEMPNDIYHNETIGISSTVNKTMAKSAAHAFARHFDPKRERDESYNLQFGTAYHALCLEGEEGFNAECALIPTDINKRTKAGKEEFAAWEAANKGKAHIKGDDMEKLQAMRDTLWAHPAAAELIGAEKAEVESSYFFHHEESGLVGKCRPDLMVIGEYIVDLKSTVDASQDSFDRSMANFGYHQSAAWYLDGIKRATGIQMKNFILVAQEKEAPYAVQCFLIDDEAIDLGRRTNEVMMQRLARAIDSGKWPAYSETIVELALPRWYAIKHGA